MQSSQPVLRLLLDENVRSELFRFLKGSGFDVKTCAKGTIDKELAAISKREKRIIVTNDRDFAAYLKDEVFAIVLLRIPQNDQQSLLVSFEKLVGQIQQFSGKLIILKEDEWDELLLENGNAS